jgi:hypothetical protein
LSRMTLCIASQLWGILYSSLEWAIVVWAAAASCDQTHTDAEGAGESVDAVGASVDQASGGSEIVGGEGATDCGLLVSQEAGEQFGGDCGFAGEGRVGDKIVAGLAGELGVVSATGELNEAAAAEVCAVGRALIAEVGPMVV